MAAEGHIDDAVSWAVEAATHAGRDEARLWEAEFLHLPARLGRPSTAGRLADLASKCDSAPIRLYADHAAALAEQDAIGLERVCAAFEISG